MKKKVRIKSLPQAQQGMTVKGFNSSFFKFAPMVDMGTGSNEDEVRTTMKPVPRHEANLEAEKGEVVVGDINADTIPEFYRVGGKPHSKGGTPLNLPDNAFIFSKDKSMRLTDEDLLAEFGKSPNKKGYSPADLAMKYDLNDYRKQLQDPDSDKLQVKTAEMMIQNYNMKLAKLGLAQESLKGFPQGIPAIAMPYIMMNNVDPSTLAGSPNQEMPREQPVAKTGMEVMAALKNRFQTGGNVLLSGPRRGDRVVYNPQSGRTEVYDKKGNFVGVLNQGQPQQQQTQTGTGQVAKTTQTSTKVQNIPDNATKHDESSKDYNAAVVKPGDYIKKSDGKWYKATGYKTQPYTGNFQDPRLKGQAGDLQEAYGRLEQTLMDPNNSDLREALIKQYRDGMAKAKPNKKTGLTQADLDAAREMTDDQVLGNFLEMQKQVMATNAAGISGKGMDPKDSWDRDRSNYEKTITQLGFQPLNKSQQAAFQGAYIGLQNLADNPKFKDALADYRVSQVGIADEPGGGTGRATISDIDGWVGNTTIGQAALYKPVLKDLQMDEVPETEVKIEEPTMPGEIGQLKQAPPSEWWLQDVVKTAGSALDLARVKKYMPWAPQFQPVIADPTFYDPTRELAANAEQMAIGTQGAAEFAGPQAFNARFSEIQGAGARNAADVMARYNNMNVGMANQFAQSNAAVQNQASMTNLGLADELYDQVTIANQQFDNAKNMARQELRKSYIDAITNKANAQVLNSLYPQYNISPITGGMMTFMGGRDLKPTFGEKQNVMDVASDYMSQYPGFNPQQYYDAAKVSMGMPQSPPFGYAPDADYYDQYAQMMSGIANPMVGTP